MYLNPPSIVRNNLRNVSSTKVAQAKLSTILHKWFQCKGDDCM